jgi:hypothetical protein
MDTQPRKVLCFGDIYMQLQTLRESVAEFRKSSAHSRECQENAPQLDVVSTSAAAVESAAAPLVEVHLDPRCIRCCAKRLRRGQPVKCSSLARSYLHYKVIEALQPHPAYESDDGFQPLWIIRTLKFDDPQSHQALAEFDGRGVPIMTIVSELVEKGIVVQTRYEACNGDVMLGLPEYQSMRQAAHEERIKMIAFLAAKFRHGAGWNEDGTGWLTPPCQKCPQISGSVWDLLAYLSSMDLAAGKRSRSPKGRMLN